MKYILIAFFVILGNSIATAQNAGMAFLERAIEIQYRYEIRTPLPQLAEEISMKYPFQPRDTLVNMASDEARQPLQSRSQFEPWPQQNTWIVLGVIAAFVITIIVLRVGFGGS
jgi:hypothetical protein